MHSFIHSFTHSLTHSLILSLILFDKLNNYIFIAIVLKPEEIIANDNIFI